MNDRDVDRVVLETALERLFEMASFADANELPFLQLVGAAKTAVANLHDMSLKPFHQLSQILVRQGLSRPERINLLGIVGANTELTEFMFQTMLRTLEGKERLSMALHLLERFGNHRTGMEILQAFVEQGEEPLRTVAENYLGTSVPADKEALLHWCRVSLPRLFGEEVRLRPAQVALKLGVNDFSDDELFEVIEAAENVGDLFSLELLEGYRRRESFVPARYLQMLSQIAAAYSPEDPSYVAFVEPFRQSSTAAEFAEGLIVLLGSESISERQRVFAFLALSSCPNEVLSIWVKQLIALLNDVGDKRTMQVSVLASRRLIAGGRSFEFELLEYVKQRPMPAGVATALRALAMSPGPKAPNYRDDLP